MIVLVRHGPTEWSVSGRHTGATDLPLTEDGRAAAASLRERLAGHDFATVLCSPLRRARETAELAGLGDRAELDDDLREYDYGAYEGLTTDEIRERRPGWYLWQDGVPDGETPDDVGARADRVIARAAAVRRRRRALRPRPHPARPRSPLDRPPRGPRRPPRARHRRGLRARPRARPARDPALERHRPPGQIEGGILQAEPEQSTRSRRAGVAEPAQRRARAERSPAPR